MLRISAATSLWRQLSTGLLRPGGAAAAGAFSSGADKPKKAEDDSFELLPPGCSMVDPTYGLRDSDTTVVYYDQAQGEDEAPPPAAKRAAAAAADDDDTFELLPPGCSMVDPTYGLRDSEPTVMFYDEAANAPPAKGKKKGSAVPPTPTNLAAAQQKLKDKAAAAVSLADDGRYVYVPPGSSMRDPGYNSVSDPGERRVHHIDPVPAAAEK